jgi:Putative 2OG-Fe(II) oxygenase
MTAIYHFKPETPKTEFAPQYDYMIFEKSLVENVNFDIVKDTILAKEKTVIEETKKQYEEMKERNKFSFDGATGLGENSLTSRSPFFNLFDWPEMKDLKLAVKNAHDEFISAIWNKTIQRRIYCQCWANVMRKGQVIGLHHHGTNQYAYLGGHISVQVNNTSTHYTNPYTREEHAIENKKGTLILFPSWIDHRTDRVEDDNERITIAFDLKTEIGFKEDIFDNMKHHWVEL